MLFRLFLSFLLFFSLAFCRGEDVRKIPQRVISVTPSITETLFALGVGEHLVAVSDFCDYPIEAKSLPRVGGLLNPNIEKMVALKPDLVILLKEHQILEEKLRQFGINTFSVDHSSIESLLVSFTELGDLFGPDARECGMALQTRIQQRFHEIAQKTEGLSRPTVLISIDRPRGTGSLSTFYAAGKNRYFNEILQITGGVNVLDDSLASVPTISAETVLLKRPDIIIDLTVRSDIERNDIDFLKEWESLGKGVPAVRNHRIFLLAEDYASVPGPRVLFLVEKIAQIIHPELDWSNSVEQNATIHEGSKSYDF